LQRVANYLAFLRVQSRPGPNTPDDRLLAALCGESAREDRELEERRDE
jgi:hypothetical protein